MTVSKKEKEAERAYFKALMAYQAREVGEWWGDMAAEYFSTGKVTLRYKDMPGVDAEPESK